MDCRQKELTRINTNRDRSDLNLINAFQSWVILFLLNPARTILGDPGTVSRAGRKGATKKFLNTTGRRVLSPVLENFRRAFSPLPD